MWMRKPFRYSYNYATFYLILANVVVYVLTAFSNEMTLVLGLFPPTFFRYKFFWQPVTYMFVHGSISHLIFNMIAVLVFGMSVEKAIGTREFLLFYFLCGIISGVLSLVTYMILGTWTLLIGASGAIYALLFLFAVVFPRAMIYVWGIVPVTSPLLVVIYAVLAVFNQLRGGYSSIAHLTHLYGFFVAWIYMVVRMGIHPLRVWRDAYRR